MCGIAGIVRKTQELDIATIVREMCDVIIHRGPDDQGQYVDENLALGHRRLSILDLTAEGHQPMHYANLYTIVFNGEIYNYLEIRETLEAQGYSFNSRSDTEVILAAYAEWGTNCLQKFNGMWAFALYDKAKQKLFCARDRFGVKPFYICNNERYFAFGSEIRQLLTGLKERKVNKQVLTDYLYLGIEEHTHETFFEGIEKLQPSHFIIYDLEDHSYETFRFYTLCRSSPEEKERWQNVNFREIFTDSIRLRLRSDVKVGSCLSGGLDSSTIVAIAARMNAAEGTVNRFMAITAKSVDETLDESHFAKIVVDKAGLDWKVTAPSREDFHSHLERIITIQEEPFRSTSIAFQYFVMQLSRESGCTVLLDGQGGDEVLLGYSRYLYLYFFELIKQFKFGAVLKAMRSGDTTWKAFLENIFYYKMPGLRKRFIKSKNPYIRWELAQSYLNKTLDKFMRHSKSFDEYIHAEISHFNLPALLKYEDKNSMAFSIETRLPFLDYRLVEYCYNLEIEKKLNGSWTKFPLRNSFEPELPPEVSWRKDKKGFISPEKLWLSGMDDNMLSTIKTSDILRKFTHINKLLESFAGLDVNTKWKLFNIAKWEKIYNVLFE